jgi:tRNA1Val (adenine37-N6)-methyltransferase
MGLEIQAALPSPVSNFDFMDVQDEFAAHFQRNIESTRLRGNWMSANYSVLETAEWSERYDLIVSNPPYFLETESSLSPSPLNNRARFFLDADLRTLLRGVRNALTPRGRAYILMKSGKEHGRDAFTSARIELFDCRVEHLADIRGTDLVKITLIRD